MEPLTEREKFIFMMAFDAGYYAKESGIIEESIEEIKAKDPETETTLHRFKFAKAFIENDEFQETARIFATGIGIDINSVEGMT